jgi:Fe2+ or Zn2+ uptake regulation protein
MFYNTTNEQGEQLKVYKAKSTNQKEKIYLYLKENPKIEFGASQITRLVFGNNTPITSTRRAINTLVNEGLAIYTGNKREGIYGRNENLIRLK